MERRRIYLLPGGRKPVQVRPRLGLCDPQAQVPAGWCCVCGAEVYGAHADLCSRCRALGLGSR